MEQIHWINRRYIQGSIYSFIIEGKGYITTMINGSDHTNKKNSIKWLCMLVMGAVILAACVSFEGSNQNPTGSPRASSTPSLETEAIPTKTPSLATPVSQEPAAGICASVEGEWVVVTIYPDIADPRCTIIAPNQMLKVVNQRQETIQVSIANMEATIEPGGEHTFNTPFGQYLAPGVHLIEVKPCCGASLWLK